MKTTREMLIMQMKSSSFLPRLLNARLRSTHSFGPPPRQSRHLRISLPPAQFLFKEFVAIIQVGET